MKLCAKCKVEKDLSEFYDNKQASDGKAYSCKLCRRDYDREWRKSNPIKCHAAQIKYMYGFENGEYETILKSQAGRCAICGTTEPRGHGRFHVDHDHVTDKVRGLLCNQCNMGIGNLQDDPDILAKAEAYLRSYKCAL